MLVDSMRLRKPSAMQGFTPDYFDSKQYSEAEISKYEAI